MRDESTLRGLKERAHLRPARSGLARARGIVLMLWLGVSAINFVVWVAVSIGSSSWDRPWWLYGFGAGGVLVAALTLIERTVSGAASNRRDW